MAAFSKFDCLVEHLAEKQHNLGSDTLKIMLTNTQPNVADTHVDAGGATCVVHATSNAAEITSFSGYAKGGPSVTIGSSSQTGGLYKLVPATDGKIVITKGDAGSSQSFQYAVLYNDSATPDKCVIGYWAYTGSISLAQNEQFTVDLDESAGILTLQIS